MTTIVYNDVILRDCETLAFDQEVIYDDSKTDAMYSRFRIRVASSIVAIRYGNPDNDHGIETYDYNATTVVQKAHDIQARLNEPRKDFWMFIESCVTDEKESDPQVMDQPLLVATGKAWHEYHDTYYVSGVEHSRIVRDPLYMKPHPFSNDADTNKYGQGSIQFEKIKVLDCENGPKPANVSIQKIIGGRAMRVEFEIVVCRPVCVRGYTDEIPVVFGSIRSTLPLEVLSNRWSLEESKDDNWVTTRTLQGTLRVGHASYWAHAFRLLCIPPLLDGYKRARQSFVSDPTDLVLKYRIDDRQAHAAPPYPAIKWSGHHAESASGPNGLTKGGEFQIRLTGPPGVDKQQLIAAAGKVAVNRINGLNPKPDSSGKRKYNLTLRNASIVDVLHEPVIEMRVQVTYHDASYKSFGLRVKRMGESLDTLDGHAYGYDPALDPYIIAGYNPRKFPVPLAYDSDTPAGIFNCYLQNPCSVWHGIPRGFEPADENEVTAAHHGYPMEGKGSGRADGEEGSTFRSAFYREEQELIEDDSDLTEDDKLYDFPVTFIELQNRYRIDNGWTQIPIADTDPEATKTSSLIQLHGRTAQRVLTMTATRDGEPPTIPSLKEDQKDHNGCREVLKRWDLIAKAPQLMADGTGRRYEIWCEYVYLMERAPKPNEKLRGGSSPLDLLSPDLNLLDLSKIVDTGGHLQWEDGVTVTYVPPSLPPSP